MTSKEIKHKLLFDLLYRRGYHMAVTEKTMFYGIADVFAMSKAEYTHELEIKTSRQDLKSEIDAIELVLSGKKQEKHLAKFHKHLAYLKLDNRGSKYSLFDPEEDTRPYILKTFEKPEVEKSRIPNKFSFAVTPDLKEYAKKSIEGTPYGLFVIHAHSIDLEVQAKHLHKEKISREEVMYLLRKVSIEIENVRGQLLAINNN